MFRLCIAVLMIASLIVLTNGRPCGSAVGTIRHKLATLYRGIMMQIGFTTLCSRSCVNTQPYWQRNSYIYCCCKRGGSSWCGYM
jgi:hypothetical protein